MKIEVSFAKKIHNTHYCLMLTIWYFFMKIGPKWIYTSYEYMYAFFWYLGPVCAHLKRKEFTTIYLWPSSLVGSLPHMATHYYRKVVLKLQSNLYKPSTAGSWILDSTIFWVVRFCTIRGITLIRDWFSTKNHEIGQFKFQSPLFFINTYLFSSGKPSYHVLKLIL